MVVNMAEVISVNKNNDVSYTILPICDLTPDRKRRALELIEQTDFKPEEWEPGEGKNSAKLALRQFPTLSRRRDVGLLTLPNQPKFVITGGPVVGTYTTDADDIMLCLNSIPGLWALFYKWAMEDLKNGKEVVS